jgi:RimJ/RimL family protein N-acetyltransferase
MELSERNLPDLRAMMQDEQIMYAWEGALSDAEIQAWYEKQLSRYERDKLGIWAAVLKKNTKFIGYCGLLVENIDGVDKLGIAYMYNREYWHNGYAAEAAKSCIRYAFAGLGYEEVVAVVRDTNLPSINVAIRSGMVAKQRIIKNYRGIDMPHIIFSVKRDAKRKK